jgi:nitroreductase
MMTVEEAITGRRCIRAFLPKPVPRELIERILHIAGRAPSGSNVQPWKVWVLDGEVKQEISAELAERYDRGQVSKREYNYYPESWREPYLARRRACGWGLYGTLGIGRQDKDKMHAQHRRNFLFFDAPVGLIFSIDRDLEQGSWLDYGMFLQNIMIAARARGLDTCPQAAFTTFHRVIARELKLPDNEMVVCGMSLGYADATKVENELSTEREPVSAFARFLD